MGDFDPMQHYRELAETFKASHTDYTGNVVECLTKLVCDFTTTQEAQDMFEQWGSLSEEDKLLMDEFAGVLKADLSGRPAGDSHPILFPLLTALRMMGSALAPGVFEIMEQDIPFNELRERHLQRKQIRQQIQELQTENENSELGEADVMRIHDFAVQLEALEKPNNLFVGMYLHSACKHGRQEITPQFLATFYPAIFTLIPSLSTVEFGYDLVEYYFRSLQPETLSVEMLTTARINNIMDDCLFVAGRSAKLQSRAESMLNLMVRSCTVEARFDYLTNILLQNPIPPIVKLLRGETERAWDMGGPSYVGSAFVTEPLSSFISVLLQSQMPEQFAQFMEGVWLLEFLLDHDVTNRTGFQTSGLAEQLPQVRQAFQQTSGELNAVIAQDPGNMMLQMSAMSMSMGWGKLSEVSRRFENGIYGKACLMEPATANSLIRKPNFFQSQ